MKFSGKISGIAYSGYASVKILLHPERVYEKAYDTDWQEKPFNNDEDITFSYAGPVSIAKGMVEAFAFDSNMYLRAQGHGEDIENLFPDANVDIYVHWYRGENALRKTISKVVVALKDRKASDVSAFIEKYC